MIDIYQFHLNGHIPNQVLKSFRYNTTKILHQTKHGRQLAHANILRAMIAKTENSNSFCTLRERENLEDWKGLPQELPPKGRVFFQKHDMPQSAKKETWNQDKKIDAIAKASLIELGISLGFGCMALGFSASAYAAPLIFGAIALQTIANTGLRYYQQFHSPSSWTAFGCNYMRPFVFSCFSGVHLQVLVHETGHALAAKALFQNARPSITISPLLGGHTTFCTSTLSSLGQKLGKARSICLVAAMGPLQGLLFSATLITIGYLVKEQFSELSNHLVGWGRGEYWTQATYALSALASSNLSHDFHVLAQSGFHPLAAAIGIMTIPIFLAWKFGHMPVQAEPASPPSILQN